MVHYAGSEEAGGCRCHSWTSVAHQCVYARSGSVERRTHIAQVTLTTRGSGPGSQFLQMYTTPASQHECLTLIFVGHTNDRCEIRLRSRPFRRFVSHINSSTDPDGVCGVRLGGRQSTNASSPEYQGHGNLRSLPCFCARCYNVPVDVPVNYLAFCSLEGALERALGQREYTAQIGVAS